MEEAYQILDSSPDFVLVVGLDKKIRWANRKGLELIAIPEKDLRALTCHEVFGKLGSAPCADCPCRKALRQGKAGSGKLVEFTVDGRTTHWLHNCAPLPDDQGTVERLVITGREVSHLLQTEHDLRRYKHIVNSAGELLALVDADYTYVLVNDAYLQAHDQERGEIVGRSVASLLGEEVFLATVKPKLDRALQGNVLHYENWFEFAGAGRRFMDVRYYPHSNGHGQVTGVIVSSRDITDRKKLEDELKGLNKNLEKRVRRRTGELEEANLSLRLLLNQVEVAKKELEEELYRGVRTLVLPYLEELRLLLAGRRELQYIDAIRTNIDRLSSSVRSEPLSSRFGVLTPRERMVADLVRQGKTSKDIARLLNVAVRTVEYYRDNIREKLGLKEKKVNLRAFLNSID